MGAQRVHLQLVLEGTEPEVWREIAVDAGLRLDRLHAVLQLLFGWHGERTHSFVDLHPLGEPVTSRAGHRWADRSRNQSGILRDESLFSVKDALRSGQLWYVYGQFAERGWVVRVMSVKWRALEHPEAPILLLRGWGRGPYTCCDAPEDFADGLALLEDLGNPRHPPWHERLELMEGPWRPLERDFMDPVALQSELNLLARTEPDALEDPDGAALVKRAEWRCDDDLTPGSPVVELVRSLPRQVRPEARMHLLRTGVADRVERIDPEAAARIVAPYRTLLRVWGPDGAARRGERTPAAGSLAPVMTRLRSQGAATDVLDPGSLDWACDILGRQALRLRLVRRFRDRWVPLVRALKVADDPVALLRLVARHLFDGLAGPHRAAALAYALEIAGGTPAPIAWMASHHVLTAQGFPTDPHLDLRDGFWDRMLLPLDEVFALPALCAFEDPIDEDATLLSRLALR